MHIPKPNECWFLRVKHRKRVLREYGPRLGHAAIAVYGLICDYADKDGKTRVGRRELCRVLKLSPKRLGETLALLEEVGLIAIQYREGCAAAEYTLLPLRAIGTVVPTGNHNLPCIVVPEAQFCGSRTNVLRFPNDEHNKELEPSGKSSSKELSKDRVSASPLDLQVSEIGHLYPTNEHLQQTAIPAYQERAIAEAILRHGYDPVLAGTLHLCAAVSNWPQTEKRFIPNLVKFYDECQYLKPPESWQRRQPRALAESKYAGFA